MQSNFTEDDSLANCQTITEFSRRHGVTLRTIRFYESCGLLQPRRISNQRYFSGKDSIRMKLTLTARRLGLSLSDIRSLIDAHSKRCEQEPQDIVDIIDADLAKRQLAALEKQKQEVEDALTVLRTASQLCR